MPRESKKQKALRYLLEDRVRVTSANQHGIRFTVRGSAPEPYEVAYGRDSNGRPLTTCTCYDGENVHTVRPKCCHIEIAKMLRGEI